jgi:hypothetical protein
MKKYAALLSMLWPLSAFASAPEEVAGIYPSLAMFNADGECGGLTQGPVLGLIGIGRLLSQAQGFMPAVQKTLSLLGHQGGHQGQCLGHQSL